uniref:hypothetical protein n=1 Tax=Snodgrassella alvi TaxID=1196083 RepID=UPI003FA34542
MRLVKTNRRTPAAAGLRTLRWLLRWIDSMSGYGKSEGYAGSDLLWPVRTLGGGRWFRGRRGNRYCCCFNTLSYGTFVIKFKYFKQFIYMNKNNLFCLSISIILGIISIFLGQDVNGDSWNYHWYNAYSYLNNRLFYDLAPADAHSYFNPYLDVLFYLCITHLPAFWYMFLIGFLHGLISFPILSICGFFLQNEKKFFKYLITIVCCFGSVFFVGQLGTSMHDNTTSLLNLFSFALLLKSNDKVNYKYLICSGIIVGVSCGLKLTNAIYVITFIVLTFFLNRNCFNLKLNIKLSVVYGFSALVGIILISGHWFWQLYVHYGNPIFPFYNHIFKSTYASVLPDATKHGYFFSEKGLEHFFYPFYFAEHIDRVASVDPKKITLYLTLCTYIIIPIAVIVYVCKENIKSLFKSKFFLLLVFFYTSFFTWQLFFGVYRYLISTDLLLPLFIFYSCLQFNKDKTNFRTAISLFIFILILTIFNYKGGYPDWGRAKPVQPYFNAVIPSELKQAKVIFTTGYFSAWEIPIIQPEGHVIPLGNMLFNWQTEKYWNQYYLFKNNQSHPNMYIIFNEYYDMEKEIENAKLKLKKYHLSFNEHECTEFKLYMSSIESTLQYCPVH